MSLDRKPPTFSEAVLSQHNHAENPVQRTTGLLLIQLTFRMLERVYKACGPEEVYNIIKCPPHMNTGRPVGEGTAASMDRRAQKKKEIARERRRQARLKNVA